MLKDFQEVTSGKGPTVSAVLLLEREWSSFSLHWLTVKRYFSYAALLRCGHQRAIALYLKAINIGLGASLVVQWFKNPPANAGDTGSILDPGRFHMPQGNSAQCATTPEPTHLLSSLESSLCVSKKTHHSQKQNKRKNAYKMSMIWHLMESEIGPGLHI